jgi:hypothetical protein
MISSSNIRGIVRGKTIELANDPGLKDGQEVEVTLRPAMEPGNSCEGLRRSAGALSNGWQAEDDEILDRIQQDRTRSTGRELPP